MNFRQRVIVTSLFCFLFADGIFAQSVGGKRLTLRSDFPSKTVTVSNINQEMGIRSPFLVAAALKLNGDQKEYRSLLQFNYDYLPELILKDPGMISSAELVLYPADADFLANGYDKPGKLVLMRIIENWNDSSIAWDNLPMVDSSTVMNEKIKIRRKTPEIRINVTNMVMDMIQYGNKGFMICPSVATVSGNTNGLSFASSLNIDTLRRPLLVITYYDGSNNSPDSQQRPARPVSTPVYTIPVRPVTASSNRSVR